MEKLTKCNKCQLNEICDCKHYSLAFFKILQKVQARVLTSSPTSINTEIELIRAGVDKVNGKFNQHPLVAAVCTNAGFLGATFKQVQLKDRKPYLEINFNSSKIHLRLDYTKSFVTSLVSNPNHFISWSKYINILEQLIPADALNTFEITRLDLNLDYNCTFEKLIESINVKNKRDMISFNDESGIRTGMNIGKGQSCLVIYDKSTKASLTYNSSRIELRLSGKMLPTKILKQLPFCLSEKNYFTQIEANHLELQTVALLDDQKTRLDEFILLARREGFYSARKKFNQNKNFDRDFKGLIKLTKWSTQPTKAFRDYILKSMSIEQALKTVH